MKKDKNQNEEYVFALAITLLILIFIALFLSLRAEYYYDSFKTHEIYFKENSSAIVESWMTPHTVLRHFNITQTTLFYALNISNSTTDLRTPISNLCVEHKIDCVSALNTINTEVVNNGS